MGGKAICAWGSGVWACSLGCVEDDLVRVDGEICEWIIEESQGCTRWRAPNRNPQTVDRTAHSCYRAVCR